MEYIVKQDERERNRDRRKRERENENIKAPEQRPLTLWKNIPHTELIIIVQIK